MFTLSAGYTEADFARAIEIVGRRGTPPAVAEGIGIEWDYLSWVALGIAEAVVEASESASPDVLAGGAEAFTAGLLIGAHLPERRNPPDNLGRQLPWAVDEVHERGRQAIIAEHCHPQTVATLQVIYTATLIETLLPAERRNSGLDAAYTQALEVGLATGLVLTRVAA